MSGKLITDHFKHKKGEHVKKDQTAGKPEPDIPGSTSAEEDRENLDLELLKQFDLNLEYGPCTGITRLQRWERANKHGLNPPQEVRDLLMNHPADKEYTECLWQGYAI